MLQRNPTLGIIVLGTATLFVKAAEPPVQPDHAAQMAASRELFASTVRGFLTENCLHCHGGEKVKSGFNLADRDLLLQGGDRGPAVIPGKSEASLMIKLLRRLEEPHMPPKNPAPQVAVDAIARWIDLGAAYDKPLIEQTKPRGKQPLVVTDKDRNYWAYRPLLPPPIPQVNHPTWQHSPIDRFLLAKMQPAGISPAAEADKRTLIRRVTFDLIGLPPTPAEVAAFLADCSENAYERVVDRLLASPHFGERWARHWLDPARFAESHGFEHDYLRPYAYHYRDFVIRAFNADMPYDQFVRWQIAGDEFAPDNPDALAATGFLGAGVYPTQITTREAERVRYDAMDDMLATTGHAILALTVGCARCHDHKYDPIPTQDYYRMLSAFTTTVRSEIDWDFGSPEEIAAMKAFEIEHKKLTDELARYESQELPAALAAWLKQQPEPLKISDGTVSQAVELFRNGTAFDKLSKPQRDAVIRWFGPQESGWQQRQAAIQAHANKRPKDTRTKIQVCSEGLKPMRHHTAVGSIPDFYPETYFLNRGDVAQKQGVAELGVLQVLSRDNQAISRWYPPPPPGSRTSGKRSALANWLVDTEYGAGALAARVIVNRLWHHHFGRGIVATVNDFGFQGDPPSHPELLEWLAHDLVQHGWKLKRLHKQLVLSQAYRQAGTANPQDPENRYWSHRPRRRLEAEAIRDSLLAVSGRLDPSMFGPGTLDERMTRRSIYFTVKRSQLIPMLQVFDWPDTLTSTGVRPTTIVAPQALVFLNHPEVKAAAEAFAKRIHRESDPIAAAYQIAFARLPSTREREAGQAFLKTHSLAEYTQVLLGLNEFIYID
jgi:mono/diheme cytochrome c family protein